jgi:hypothetical protein
MSPRSLNNSIGFEGDSIIKENNYDLIVGNESQRNQFEDPYQNSIIRI